MTEADLYNAIAAHIEAVDVGDDKGVEHDVFTHAETWDEQAVLADRRFILMPETSSEPPRGRLRCRDRTVTFALIVFYTWARQTGRRMLTDGRLVTNALDALPTIDGIEEVERLGPGQVTVLTASQLVAEFRFTVRYLGA